MVKTIKQLPQNRKYNYPHLGTKTLVRFLRSDGPEGPIAIERTTKTGKVETATISTQMIWRVSSAISEGVPLNLDRILGASYNTRSALEALLAHTPNFYVCYPGRFEAMNSAKEIKKGHKHLLYLPREPHVNGVLSTKNVDIVISEAATPKDIVFEGLQIPDSIVVPEIGVDIQRRHALIQFCLVKVGQQLGYRTWVARNDRGIVCDGQKISSFDGVISDLREEMVLSAYGDAAKKADLIDCIWFKNGRLMPAVMEIEHSTGVNSGLARMKNFYDQAPALRNIRWTIVAPDEDRHTVFRKASEEQYRDMEIKYFPYSAVEELYYLCTERKISGVSEEFLDSFIENIAA